MDNFSFFEKAEWVLKGHVFNPFWWPRNKRRMYRGHVKYKIIKKHCLPYLSVVSNIKDTPAVKNDKNEKIYSLWLQGEENAPELVKACFRSIRRHCSQELIVLNENNLFDYISLPDYIIEKRKNGKISNAHFADIARVELLYNHGGFWMDATDFATSKIPQDIVNQDFFMFLWLKESDFSYGFVQNCFIRARKDAYLLVAWRNFIHEYWKNETAELDYFIHQILFRILIENDKRAKKYFSEMLKIDQEIAHKLWPHHKEEFDKDLYEELISETFFQKTRYADTKELIDGSFAEALIKV